MHFKSRKNKRIRIKNRFVFIVFILTLSFIIVSSKTNETIQEKVYKNKNNQKQHFFICVHPLAGQHIIEFPKHDNISFIFRKYPEENQYN